MPMTFAQETHPIASHGTDYLLIVVDTNSFTMHPLAVSKSSAITYQ